MKTGITALCLLVLSALALLGFQAAGGRLFAAELFIPAFIGALTTAICAGILIWIRFSQDFKDPEE